MDKLSKWTPFKWWDTIIRYIALEDGGATVEAIQYLSMKNKAGYNGGGIGTSIIETGIAVMLTEGHIELVPGSDNKYIVTDKGRAFLWTDKYVWRAKRQRQEYKSHKYDAITKKFVYKTRFWPHILAAAAVLVSILALVVAIAAYYKPEKGQLSPIPTQKEKTQVRCSDTLHKTDTVLKMRT